MPSRYRSLKSLVLAALNRAGAEKRLDVAEHLLHALEILDGNDTRSRDKILLRLIKGGAARI